MKIFFFFFAHTFLQKEHEAEKETRTKMRGYDSDDDRMFGWTEKKEMEEIVLDVNETEIHDEWGAADD